jgi:hypothetical protein
MDTDTDVYDLGEIDNLSLNDDLLPQPEEKPPRQMQRSKVKNTRLREQIDLKLPAPLPDMHDDPDWTAVPSLFIPGATHLLRGEMIKAVCLMTLIAFTLSLGWAIHATLDRLAPTLEFLGLPAAAAVWTLGILAVCLAFTHVAGVYSGARPSRRMRRVHPAVAGVASGIVPGLGQLLIGDRIRAVLLMTGVWLTAGSWGIVSPWTMELLASQHLVLPPWMAIVSSPAVRWTFPAVLWSLAIYDAVVRAGRIR